MAEATYPRTPVGEVEIKRLPARTAYEAHGERDVFEERGDLFQRNFRFLQENQIAMTVPVEVDVEHPAMRFYVPEETEGEEWEGVEGVEVRAMAERLVVSVGLRGGYSRRRFEKGARKARAWLASRPDLEAVGEPEVAYWHGPMMPPFLRRFEVHIPIRERDARSREAPEV